MRNEEGGKPTVGRVGLESLAAARAERRGRLQEAGEFDATYLHLKKVAA